MVSFDVADRSTTAIIVDYFAGEFLSRAINSLFADGVARVVVVDNSEEMASLGSPYYQDERVDFIFAEKNLGYGAAVNRALVRVDTPFVIVSNPDIAVAPGTIAKLIDSALDPSVGIVGPEVLDSDGVRYPSFRRFPSFIDSIGHGMLGQFLPNNRFSAHYKLAGLHPIEAVEVPWVSGAFFLARTEVLNSLGGFDPAYFMYCEDIDLCYRASRRGFVVVYQPEATVTHAQGESSKLVATRSLYHHHRSMWIYAARHERSTATQWFGFFGLILRFFILISRNKFQRMRLSASQVDKSY
ncbi:MAG: glycosyltransferase family 2 protein [Acidimicrobiaceae bacterium]|nr:glycosyltransferase family 2 protein [Acidimicrobiaceae bacterium]